MLLACPRIFFLFKSGCYFIVHMGHILFTHSHEGRWDVLTCWLFMWLWMYNDADMNPDLQIYSFASCLGVEDLKDHFQLPSFVTASLLPALYTKGLRSLLPMDRRSWYVRLQPPCLWKDGWMGEFATIFQVPWGCQTAFPRVSACWIC